MNFPDAGMAQPQFVAAFVDGPFGGGAEIVWRRGQPNEHARIQQKPHPIPHSVISSSVNGAKHPGLTRMGPEVISPTFGRRPVFLRKGTSKATGWLPRQT